MKESCFFRIGGHLAVAGAEGDEAKSTLTGCKAIQELCSAHFSLTLLRMHLLR